MKFKKIYAVSFQKERFPIVICQDCLAQLAASSSDTIKLVYKC